MSILPKSRLRGLAKTGCASAMYWPRLDKVVGACRSLNKAPLVLGYHRIVQSFEHSDRLSMPSMLTSARTFEQHIDWIGKHYDFVSLDDLALIHEGGNKQGKPVAAITFDDGYQDVYWNAFPILKRKGIPSAVFVITDLVGTSGLQAHDELYLLLSELLKRGEARSENYWQEIVVSSGLPFDQATRLCCRISHVNDPFQASRAVLETLSQPGIQNLIKILRKRIFLSENIPADFQSLDWGMLREMVAGGMTVGSHTKSHVLLANEPPDVVREEVEVSRRELERQLGTPIRHFAYPDGNFNESTVAAVAAAGYRTAYTICGHRDSCHRLLTIPRRMLWQNACTDSFGQFSPAILSCLVNGVFDLSARCHKQH